MIPRMAIIFAFAFPPLAASAEPASPLPEHAAVCFEKRGEKVYANCDLENRGPKLRVETRVETGTQLGGRNGDGVETGTQLIVYTILSILAASQFRPPDPLAASQFRPLD
jgi:hypothetical protein